MTLLLSLPFPRLPAFIILFACLACFCLHRYMAAGLQLALWLSSLHSPQTAAEQYLKVFD